MSKPFTQKKPALWVLVGPFAAGVMVGYAYAGPSKGDPCDGHAEMCARSLSSALTPFAWERGVSDKNPEVNAWFSYSDAIAPSYELPRESFLFS